jgi:two-component system, NtrC family, sensor kinase
MASRIRTTILHYGVAVLSFGASWLLTDILWPLIDPASTPIFFAAVMVSAFYGGLGPGLLTTALSTWAIDYFFSPPFRAIEINTGNLVRGMVFVLVAALISWLNAARKKLMDDLSHRNHERELFLAQISSFNDELRMKVEAATRELSMSNQALLRTQQRLNCSERLAVAGQMTASLAHEIGTPLNAISGHLQLLARDHPQHSDTQRRVQIVNKQLDFIIGIVRKLLELTHKKPIPFKLTDINSLINEILSLASPMLEQHAVNVSTDLAADLPLIQIDRDGFHQVFLNLINNSLDAMPHGGRLEIATRLDRNNQKIELILHDTGTGIDPSAVEHIFEPMWTTKSSGSGFGLAIAREIITEHGGQVEYIDDQRRGATFLVKLPLIDAKPAPESPKEMMTNVT